MNKEKIWQSILLAKGRNALVSCLQTRKEAIQVLIVSLTGSQKGLPIRMLFLFQLEKERLTRKTQYRKI